MYFSSAVEIVDLYHAREHLYELCKVLLPEDQRKRIRLKKRFKGLLDKGKIEKIITEAQVLMPRSGRRRVAVLKQIGYFRNNAARMRYGHYRAQGLFVGSGVVEAGCKTVIGKRLKQSGMEWTVRGANAIIALRCCHLSRRMEEFYEQQAA